MTILCEDRITYILLQRTLFGIGIALGLLPLIGSLLTALDNDLSSLTRVALLLSGLTVLPASLLAFWHRRAAAAWFSLASLGICIASASKQTIAGNSGLMLLLLLGVLTIFSLVAEFMRWPLVLAKG